MQKESKMSTDNVVVRVHYFRENNDYENWNLWQWDHSGLNDGRSIEFKPAEYGRVAEFMIDRKDIEKKTLLYGKSSNLGFIVRKSISGREWDQKDIEQDREIVLGIDQAVDVYIVKGKKEIIYGTNENQRDWFERIVDCRREDTFVSESSRQFGKSKTKGIYIDTPIKIKFHYKRYDDNYYGWGIHKWEKYRSPETLEDPGRGIEFTSQDEYGKVAILEVDNPKDIKKIGFLIRKGNWEERDGDIDRYLHWSKICEEAEKRSADTVDVYLIQNDFRVSFRKEDVDISRKILIASVDDPGSSNDYRYITVELTNPLGNHMIRDLKRYVTLKEGQNNLDIEKIELLDRENRKLRIFLREPIRPFDNKYILDIEEYGGVKLSLVNLYDKHEFIEKLTYDGDDLGANYSKERTDFKVWAPTAQKIELLIYKDGIKDDGEPEKISMKEDIKGTWMTTVYENLDGKFYTYRSYVDGKVNDAVDPYAKAVGVAGLRGAIVDFNKTEPEENWRNIELPELKKHTDAVIYELHIRDYTIDESSGVSSKHRGKFLGLAEPGTKYGGYRTGLDHLKELGVTHVQLMPIFDFNNVDEENPQNKREWGYNPLNYFVPEGSYATDATNPYVRIKELKEMINSMQEYGIRVNMDVVFNHTFKTEGFSGNLLVPGYYHRPGEGIPFSNGTGCGNEVHTQRKMVRKMILDCLKYWAKEYNINGFRFDMLQLIDRETMRQIRKDMDKLGVDVDMIERDLKMVYGEGYELDWGMKSTLKEEDRVQLSNAKRMYYQDGNVTSLFNRDFAVAAKGGFNNEETGFASHGTRKREMIGAILASENVFGSPQQCVNLIDDHDNLCLFDKFKKSVGDKFEGIMGRIKFALSNLLTAQGIPLLSEGTEFGRTKEGNQNSFDNCNGNGDRINGINWKFKADETRRKVWEYTKGCTRLRVRHPGFRFATRKEVDGHVRLIDDGNDKVIAFTINKEHLHNHDRSGCKSCESWKDPCRSIAVVHNASENFVEIPHLPERDWAVLADGNSAGNAIIREIHDGKIAVPPYSTVVLSDIEGAKKVEDEITKEARALKQKEDEAIKRGAELRSEADELRRKLERIERSEKIIRGKYELCQQEASAIRI